MHQLVASLGRWGWRLQGPEHRDGQGERHGKREGDVEVLAHRLECIDPQSQWQAWVFIERIRAEVEKCPKSGSWEFR